MKKSLICLLIILVGNLFAAAQPTEPLRPATLAEINQLFQTSRSAQQSLLRASVQQEVKFALHSTAPHAAATQPLPRKAPAKSTPPVGNAEHPWQLLLFVAVHDDTQRLPATLNRLRNSIRQGTLQHAVVLDITHTQQAKLYFLYADQEQPRTEIKLISNVIDTDDLLDTLLSNFKTDSSHLYTAMILSAHGSGMEMFYQDDFVDAHNIVDAAMRQQLTFDVVDMDACHMNSLYTAYHFAKAGVVSYMSGSSDYEYGTPDNAVLFPLLNYLHYQPQDAARLAVNRRANIFNFWEEGYDTTSYAAVNLSRLKQPLLTYYTRYVFLQLSAPEISADFERLFQTKTGWNSLSFIVNKQREYVQTHFDQIQSTENNIEKIKTDFIAAAEDLLEALPQATLSQWCYSAKYDKLYTQQVPLWNDCMQSISVNKYQLQALWNEESEALRPHWQKLTSPQRLFRFI